MSAGRKISFDRYTARSDVAAERRAGDTRMPMLMRVELACVQRMNNWNHASFDKDELARIVHRDVEMLTEGQRRTVRENIKTLVKVGLAAPGSTADCVVLDRGTYQRGGGKGGFDDQCLVMAHRKLRRATWTFDATPGGRWDTADGGTSAPAPVPEVRAAPAPEAAQAIQPDPWASPLGPVPPAGCGTCYACKAGSPHYCAARPQVA